MIDGASQPRGVSVVIPTIGRSSLAEAVSSAASQATRQIPVEVVVVADIPEMSPIPLADYSCEAFAEVTLLYTGGGAGGAQARNLGLRAANMPFIAFLDDDDVFLPGKLALQLDVIAKSNESRLIVAGRAEYRIEGRDITVVPRCCYQSGPLGDYLFINRRLATDRNLVPTPTWLMTKELAAAVGWTPGLSRHQDWDFLLRAQADHGAILLQMSETVASVATESERSITASSGALASFDWATSVQHLLSRKAFSDFVVGQPVRYALQARQFRLAVRLLRVSTKVCRPSRRAVALALTGLFGRSRLSKMMSRSARHGSRSRSLE